MKSVSPLLAVVIAIGLSVPAIGQSSRLQSGSGHHEKYSFYYDTHLDPAGQLSDSLGGGILVEEVFHRFMLDSRQKVYFGYDASVEPLADGTSYRVTFRPLSLSPQSLRAIIGGDPTGWTRLNTPGWNVQTPQVLNRGQVFALTLMTNSTTGQRIVDYVTIQEPPQQRRGFNAIVSREREFSFVGGTARDFRVEDAELRILAPRVSVNGQTDSSALVRNSDDIDVEGRILWIYVPNRGRFLLSLAPQHQFGPVKFGEVRGSTLTFKSGSDTYSVVAGAPIAPGHAPFNLYFVHQPAWKPGYPSADLSKVTFGVFDPAEGTSK
jgi:hypothetical protein